MNREVGQCYRAGDDDLIKNEEIANVGENLDLSFKGKQHSNEVEIVESNVNGVNENLSPSEKAYININPASSTERPNSDLDLLKEQSTKLGSPEGKKREENKEKVEEVDESRIIFGIEYPVISATKAVILLLVNAFFPGVGTILIGIIGGKDRCCWFWIGN